MNKTLDQLRAALASMWGFENFADLLAQDQTDIDTYINAALFDCYAPVDGSRAYWPEKYHTGTLLAPVVVTLTLTNGSRTVVGHSFNTAYLGSFVKIGERFYRSASASELHAAWDGDTGTYGATVYFNAVTLPWSVIEVCGRPNVIGLGLLAPLPDAEAELELRTEPAFDFYPRNSREMFSAPRQAFRQSVYFDSGDPRYYHIDQAALGASFAIGSRFHVYPIPERTYTFELRASVAPPALTTGSSTPDLPAQAVDNILLPIAREKLVNNTANRRYTGPNVELIAREADRARAQLKTLRRVQRETGGTVRLKRGW